MSFSCALIVWVLTEQAVPLWLHFKGKLEESPCIQGGGISDYHR